MPVARALRGESTHKPNAVGGITTMGGKEAGLVA